MLLTDLRIVGINDDFDTCLCCGKTGLKKVVWIADVSDPFAEAKPYGCVCAGYVLGWGKLAEGKARARAELEAQKYRTEKRLAARAEYVATIEYREYSNALRGLNGVVGFQERMNILSPYLAAINNIKDIIGSKHGLPACEVREYV